MDRIQLLYRNAKQMKKIVAAKYNNMKFEESLVKSDPAPECAQGYDVGPAIRWLAKDRSLTSVGKR